MPERFSSEEFISWVMVVPTTAIILTGHVGLGAAIVVGVIVAGLIAVRARIRAEARSEQGILTYASTATSLGTDPAPVIRAIRRQQRDDGEDDEGPKVHLPPRR